MITVLVSLVAIITETFQNVLPGDYTTIYNHISHVSKYYCEYVEEVLFVFVILL